MPTATSARSSRSRSSSRCEISVPSASFSGSSLIGAARLRGLSGGRVAVGCPVARRVRRRGGYRLDRRRWGGTLGLAGLLELYFLLELLTKLPRHGARPSDPTAQF